ncbi:MAG TPA: DNA topoisomerase VI subunit B, partial [Anaeromyxobacter sp.]
MMGVRKSAVSKGKAKAKGAAKPAGKGGAQLELVALPPARKEARAAPPLAKPPRGSKKGGAPRAQPELLPVAEEVEAAPPEKPSRRRATAEQMAA